MRSTKLVLLWLCIVAGIKGQPANSFFITPQQLAAGTGDTKVKIQGYGFTSTMQVEWNGQRRATEFVNDFLLKATITRTDLAAPSLGQLSLIDTSNGHTIGVPVPVLIYLPIMHNSLTYDPGSGKIYVAVSKQDPNGPSIAIVDPSQGNVERYIPEPSDPGPLAVTSDSKYLYIGMADRIRRTDLTGSSPDADVPAAAINAFEPGIPAGALIQPTGLLVLPNQDTSFVVAIDNGTANQNAFVIDGTTIRPDKSNNSGRCLIGAPDGVTIYGGPGLRETLLQDTGLLAVPTFENDALDAGPTCPVYANGLIYGSDGDVVNPVTQSRVQWIWALGSLGVVPESNQVYFLDRQGGANVEPITLQFKVFDSQTGTLLRTIPLGLTMSNSDVGSATGRIIHWGTDGVAFGDYSSANAYVAGWLYVFRLP